MKRFLSAGLGLLALAAILGLGFPRAAAAQGRTWAGQSLAQMVQSALWRFGDVRINASLTLANTGYDTDIYYGYRDTPVPDVTMVASVPVQVLMPFGKKFVLELVETPQYLAFLRTPSERAWNNVLGGRLHLALKRLYFQAGGVLASVRQRMSSELDINIREKTDSLGGTVLWQPSAGFSAAAICNFTRYDFGTGEFNGLSLSEILNRKETYFDAVVYMQPNTKVRFFLDGQYGIHNFSGPQSRRPNTRTYGLFGGLAFVPQVKERSVEPPKGSISVGYKRFDIIDPAFTDGSGFVGRVDFSIGLIRKTELGLFLGRDFSFSLFSDGAYYLSTSLGGRLSRRLTRRITLSYDLLLGSGKYPAQEGEPAPTGLDFRSTDHVLGLSTTLARNVNMIVLASLSRRSGGEVRHRGSRGFFGVSVVYGTPVSSILAPLRGLS
jgi:hypothetical protein